MEIWFLVAVLGSLTIGNYWLSRSVLYPPFAFSAIWLIALLVYGAGLIPINPLHGTVLLIIGLGAFSFSLGGGLARLIPKQVINKRIKIGSAEPVQGVHLWKALMLFTGFVGMIYLAHATIANGLRGGGGSILANARSAGLEGNADSGGIGTVLSAYISVWQNCSATMFLVERRDWWFWTMATIAFITAIFTTGRGPILEIFVMLATAHLFKSGRLRFTAALKFARLPILIFFLLYIGLTFANKDTSTLDGGIFGIITYFVVGYMIGPIAALDHVVQHASAYASDPNHTFKFALKVGALLHLWSYTSPPLFDQFIEVPFPTNVYTGYKFYFTDFGFVGCILAVGVIGFVQTVFYRKALAKSTLGLYMLTFLTFCLIMFIFDDLYSAVGQLLCAATFGVLYVLFRPMRLAPAGTLPSIKIRLLPSRSKLPMELRGARED